MWSSNAKKQTSPKQNKNNNNTYLLNTHAHAHAHRHSHAHIKFFNNNLYSDIHSFIYMNIQYIYNTHLVQKDKTYIHTCTRYICNL